MTEKRSGSCAAPLSLFCEGDDVIYINRRASWFAGAKDDKCHDVECLSFLIYNEVDHLESLEETCNYQTNCTHPILNTTFKCGDDDNYNIYEQIIYYCTETGDRWQIENNYNLLFYTISVFVKFSSCLKAASNLFNNSGEREFLNWTIYIFHFVYAWLNFSHCLKQNIYLN